MFVRSLRPLVGHAASIGGSENLRTPVHHVFLPSSPLCSGAASLASYNQDPSPLYIVSAADDTAAIRGEVCIEGSFGTARGGLCQSVDDGRPCCNPSMPAVDFREQVGSSTNLHRSASATSGNCAVNDLRRLFGGQGGQRVRSAQPARPKRIRSNSSLSRATTELFFTPKTVGTFQDALVIVSTTRVLEIRLPILLSSADVLSRRHPRHDRFQLATGVGATRTQTVRIIHAARNSTGQHPSVTPELDGNNGNSANSGNNWRRHKRQQQQRILTRTRTE